MPLEITAATTGMESSQDGESQHIPHNTKAENAVARDESKQMVRLLLDELVAGQSRDPSAGNLDVSATIIAYLGLQHPKRLKEPQILKGIMRHYRSVVYDQPLLQFERLALVLDHTIQGYEFPIVRTEGTYRYHSRTYYLKHAQRYSVTLAAATIFLQPFFAQQQAEKLSRPLQEPCRLMQLPLELRDQIYSLVLGIPSNTVSIHRKPKSILMLVSVLDNLHDNNVRNWRFDVSRSCAYRYPKEKRHCSPPASLGNFDTNRLLALLSTSKTIYREATPIFFGINSFVCRCLAHLNEFLALPLSRLKLVRDITIFYVPCHTEFAVECFTRLGEIEKLKRVIIRLDTSDFRTPRWENGGNTCTWVQEDITGLPGMGMLFALKATRKDVITFDITGDWDICSAFDDTMNAAVGSVNDQET